MGKGIVVRLSSIFRRLDRRKGIGLASSVLLDRRCAAKVDRPPNPEVRQTEMPCTKARGVSLHFQAWRYSDDTA